MRLMAEKKKKYYVVWKGMTPGVYSTWAECESAIRGFSNAKFKSFPTEALAEVAFREGPDAYWGTGQLVSSLSAAELARIGHPIAESLCVDAACDMKAGVMEYRGVWNHDKSIAFHQGPFAHANNNIGEFLAIVHALAHMAQRSMDWPVYSDSLTAISWVTKKAVRSKAISNGQTSRRINDLVERGLRWLNEHEFENEILKWETEAWGEVPADFGRK